MTETALAATARMYVNAGWSVFPLWWIADCGRCACPAGAGCHSPGKHPLVRTGVNEASRDLAAVTDWWLRWPEANIGVPAGDNGLAILDIDPRHDGHVSLARLLDGLAETGRSMPTTLTQLTGGGGFHLVFTAPDGGIKGRANAFGPNMSGIDTRGRGGYIVAAPSIHATGHPYRWVDFMAETAAWPAALSVLMDPPKPITAAKRPSPPTVGDGDAFLMGSVEAYAVVALKGEALRVANAAEGERNHTLNVAAFNLGQLVAVDLLTVEQVTDTLVDAAAQCGLSGAEVMTTIRSGLRGGQRAPREIGGAA